MRRSGFTLVELMITVALLAVLLALVAPSFTSFIQMQRLRGTNAQLVTDIQFARSEAASRNALMHMKFQAAASGSDMSCYVMYTSPTDISSNALVGECDCKRAEGSRCVSPATEVRTVQLPADLAVRLATLAGEPQHFAFDPRTGGIRIPAVDTEPADPGNYAIETFLDSQRKLRNRVSLAGRVSVCAPAGSTMSEAAC